MFATIVPRLGALLAQRGVQAVVAGILSGAVVGAGGVASGLIPVGAPRAAATVALLACPGSGPELARVSSGQPLLVTARSQDGRWLQVFVGEPGIDRGWAPAAMLRLQSAGDNLPVAACDLPVTAGSPPATASIPTPGPTPAPGSTVQATVLPTPGPTLAPGATPTARPKSTATPKPTPVPTPVPTPHVTPSPTPLITPPPDLTPPSITGVSITGAYTSGDGNYYIFNVGSGCGSSSATISITVTDSGGSGLAGYTVTLHWKDPYGTQHNQQMTYNFTTHLYSSTVTNPTSTWPDSNLEYWVTASDNAGNATETSHPPDNSHWLFEGSCIP